MRFSILTIERLLRRVFIDFMHEVIRASAPLEAGLRQAAAEQKAGWVYVIDLRTPDGPQGTVPAEDIIGAFAVRDGELLPESYQPNSKHLVLTKDGPVQLPQSLKEALVRAAMAS